MGHRGQAVCDGHSAGNDSLNGRGQTSRSKTSYTRWIPKIDNIALRSKAFREKGYMTRICMSVFEVKYVMEQDMHVQTLLFTLS